MSALLRPPRRSEAPELLDGPVADLGELAANLADLRRTDALIGASRLAWRALGPLLAARPHGAPASLLDVAAGGSAWPGAARARAVAAGRELRVAASDRLLPALLMARRAGGPQLLCHDALRVPLRDGAFDYATCLLALHHFPPDAAAELLAELARVARVAAVVVDLRRSWAGYLGARLMALGPWGAMARHDGPLSALRAYTPAELRQIAARAGVRAEVRAAGLLMCAVVAGGGATTPS